MKYCAKCGNELEQGDKYCINCGEPVETPPTDNFGTQTHYQGPPQTSGMGITSFVLALISLFLPIPYLDVAIGVVAVVLAIIVISKQPKKGLAIAGLIIGLLAVIGGLSLLVEGGYDDIWDNFTFIGRLFL